MGMLRAIAAAALATALASCGSEAAPPPQGPPSTHTPPSAATTTPPVMPNAATEQTPAGAAAFVAHYMDVITYAEQTLDTAPLAALSLPTCTGCSGGIAALKKIHRKGGKILGAHVGASSIHAGPLDEHGIIAVWFDETNAKERVVYPDKPTVIHPAGTHPRLMTLVRANGEWRASQYGERP